MNFMFLDVSRVFTHELVRHRVGTAMSQQSLRYVRPENMRFWIPPALQEIENIETMFKDHWDHCQRVYNAVLRGAAKKETGAETLEAFNDLPMNSKKKYTSAARRFLPIGLATKIGWTANIRTIRTVLAQRASPYAEEEIQMVFLEVAKLCKDRWPNLFWDMEIFEDRVEFENVRI